MARIIVDEKVCKGCSMCIHACPKKIIALAKDRLNAKGYHPAELTDEAAAISEKFIRRIWKSWRGLSVIF